MSSLPQRPQLLSFLEASAIASLPTLIFMKRSFRSFRYFAASNCAACYLGDIRRSPVFHQAGCGINALTGHVTLLHDPRRDVAPQCLHWSQETQEISK